jgi:hypothetical protein
MAWLQDLLETSDFKAAVAGLAREFRARHALPAVHQLGLVVPDAEAAATELEQRGIGPFFIAAGQPKLWREQGEDKTFQGKLGFAYHQGFELELLEPGQGSDFYRRSLDPQGRIVVQHLGFLCPDVDAAAGRLGSPVRVRGRIKTGPMVTEFAYLDTEAEAGLVIEFISWRFLGLAFTPLRGLVHALGRLEKWSGKRCLNLIPARPPGK